jgi:hypothetical protein
MLGSDVQQPAPANRLRGNATLLRGNFVIDGQGANPVQIKIFTIRFSWLHQACHIVATCYIGATCYIDNCQFDNLFMVIIV